MAKGPTRTQGPGKPSREVRDIKKVSRDSDPNKGKRRGGFHSTPRGKKDYTRKEKHKDTSYSEPEDEMVGTPLTPLDETYREMMFPIADTLNWDIPAEGRPCGEGEDPGRGHCNPNLPPSGGGGFTEHQQQLEQQMGRPLNPSEWMDAKKQWSAENPEQTEQEKEQFGEKRKLALEDVKRKKAQQRQEQRQGRQEDKGIFGPQPGDMPAPPEQGPEPGPGDWEEMQDAKRHPLERRQEEEDYGTTPVSPRVREVQDLEIEKRNLMMDPNLHPQDREDYMKHYDEEKKRLAPSAVAELNWSTHKPETFKDTGEKGLHPAWGLKSVIDRGVKPHEKPDGDKRIGEADHQTTKRDVDSKSFKSYSMVHAFNWS